MKGDRNMKRIVVTNNKKVSAQYSDKVEVVYLENASGMDVLQEGKRIASEGASLLINPVKYKGYYRSLAFFKNGKSEPEGNTISMLDQSIEATRKQNGAASKEPILSGIFQNKDLDVIKKVLG